MSELCACFGLKGVCLCVGGIIVTYDMGILKSCTYHLHALYALNFDSFWSFPG